MIQNYDSASNPEMESQILLQASPINLKTMDSRNQNPVKNFQTKLSQLDAPTTNRIVTQYDLVVTSGTLAPDNYIQESYLINGQFPGPTIRVKQNSILIVNVKNNLTKNCFTIHFHGIHQRRSFLSDGVPLVTQNLIRPGETYKYKIDTWPQAGTFFYHAHTGMDILSLYGPLIIEDDPVTYKTWPAAYQYDDDKEFILNGVYHESLENLVQNIVGPVHKYPQKPESITFNGKSYGEWEVENLTTPRPPSGYEVVSVTKGLRYRFRFINAASDSLLLCNISSHVFTVIEMDGIYTEPVETDELLISPGQRYSIIVEMNQNVGNYPISCKHTDTLGPKNGVAILNYKGGSYPSKQLRQRDMGLGNESVPLNRWILDDLFPNYALNQTDVYGLPPDVDREFMVDVDDVFNGTQNLYRVNGHYYVDPEIPYYLQLSQSVNISDPPQVFEIRKDEVVQFIFQNRRGRRCFSHPWHIHGHTFYVVGEGKGLYDPIKDGEMIRENTKAGNSNKFRFRDTVTLFVNETVPLNKTAGSPCGWTAVRFKANNPGLWLSHCHVTPHMLMGKKFIIWEHPEDDPFLHDIQSYVLVE